MGTRESLNSVPGEGLAASAFTRVELLTILAFLSLLVLTGLPSLARSREGGHEAVCRNNLRRLGAAMLMYSGENKDVVPEEGNVILLITDSQNANAWYNLAVQPAFRSLKDLYASGTPPVPTDGSIFSCPACAMPDPGNGFKTPPNVLKAFFMYGENARLCINQSTVASGVPQTRFSGVIKPADTILVAETDPNSKDNSLPSASNCTAQYGVARHNDRGNMAMCDGGVRSGRTNEFKFDTAASNSAAEEWRIDRKFHWYPTPTTRN